MYAYYVDKKSLATLYNERLFKMKGDRHKWRGKKGQDPAANQIGYLSAISRHKLCKAAEAVLP